MIEESGTVVAHEGGFVQVVTERRSVCGGCVANGACGTSLLERVFSRAPVPVRALNQAGAKVGDRVVIGVSERGLLAGAVALYLVPLLGLVGGLVLGAVVGDALPGTGLASLIDTDLRALLGAVIGFALALFWLRGYSAAGRDGAGEQPVVLRIQGSSVSVRLESPSAAPSMRP
jgi:sigma-E factor negative regulatory protein RseC